MALGRGTLIDNTSVRVRASHPIRPVVRAGRSIFVRKNRYRLSQYHGDAGV